MYLENFPKLSAQYKDNLKVKRNLDINSEYETFEKDEERRKKKQKVKRKTTRKSLKASSGGNLFRRIDYSNIKDMNELDSTGRVLHVLRRQH